MSYNTCQVKRCRYNEEHTTERHCCGTCNLHGHGQIECGNENLIKELEQYKDDRIYNWCEIEGCIDSHTHTTNGHSCLYCDKRISNSHLKCCPGNENSNGNVNSICDNVLDFNSKLLEHIEDEKLNIGEYKKSDGGMGCMWLIRNNNSKNYGNKEYLFMHSDNWGQYGEDTSHLPRYKAFIYGYTLVE
jgi:hypothetical protein